MSQLSSIIIKGFKCFEDFSVKFKNLTVFAGANSVGKSSIIQSLLICRSAYDHNNEEINRRIRLSIAKKKILLNGDFCLALGNSKLIENPKTDKISFDFKFKDNSEYYFNFKNDGTQALQHIELDDVQYENPKSNILSEQSFGNQGFYYLNAERIGPRISYDTSSFPYTHCGWQGEFTTQVLAEHGYTFKVLSEKMFAGNKNENLLSQTTSWMNFIIPDVNIDSKIYDEINKARTLFNKNIPYNVGFGISYILPIIVSGLIASHNSIFIIENPEAHLHPYGQSKIGQFLGTIASSGVQVIVETHSEHVINGIRLAALNNEIPLKSSEIQINFLDKVEDNVNITDIGVSNLGDLSHWPKGFLDQTQSDFAEMIKLKRK